MDLDAPCRGAAQPRAAGLGIRRSTRPGAHWVLVSNCVEIRLYGYGRGREAYEVFDLARLDERGGARAALAHARRPNVCSAARLEQLLRDTDAAYEDITDELYSDYRALRDRLIDFLVDSADGPRLALVAAIEPAQKILDRILFIAFAQRTDLMRDGPAGSAPKAHNEFNPAPALAAISSRFSALVDKGNIALDIPPYNGGLFAHDALVDALVLPDALAKDSRRARRLGLSQRSAGDRARPHFRAIDHRHREEGAEARGEAPPKVSARKRTASSTRRTW